MKQYKLKTLALIGLSLLAAHTATAVNIAPTGTALMGSNNTTIGDNGTPNGDVPARINDGSFATFANNSSVSATNIYGFVGISWPSARTELVKSLTVTMATRADGGWFGNLECPLAGHPLTPPMLVAPIVQVSTDLFNWTAVPATTNYIAAFTGHRTGENGGATSRAFTVDLKHAQTAIRGIRVIGLTGGYGDGNGYLGIYELAVEADVLTDTDADGMSDAWETANGLVVGTNDAALDADSDGLSNVLEFRWSTNPQLADTDSDGLTDGAEHTTHGTFPSVADTDGDGLSDSAEISTHLTNAKVADSDGDGLSDGAEIFAYFTLPLDSDSDDDGFSDGKEIAFGTNPLNAASRLANIARAGTGIIGRNATNSPANLAVSGTARTNQGMNASLIDGDFFTRADTVGMTAAGTASHAGVLWSAPWPQPVARIEVTFGAFFAPSIGSTGGWFSDVGNYPNRGATLTGTEIGAVPFLQTTTNGTTWTTVPSGDYTTNYVARLIGTPIGGLKTPEVSTRSAYFTLNTPMSGIRGIRVAARHANFLAVYEIAVCDTSTPDDTDGDGLSDIAEAANSTAVDFTDTDGDNVSDFAELNILTTNPAVADTDGDTYPDGLEAKFATAPTSAASNPANPALIGQGIMGIHSSIGTTLGTPASFITANSAGNLTDGNPFSWMDTANGSDTLSPYSYIGALFPAPVKASAVKVALITMNNGGWFGPTNLRPGVGGALTAAHLIEPVVQTSFDFGVNWFTVPATSNYIAALTGHIIAGANNIPTAAPEVTFTLLAPATGITGIRIIGREGGAQPFVAASEFTVVPSNALPATTVNIPLVPIGNPGNAPHVSGRGVVNYEFSISPHEITLEQYCAFLNAVAASDPHGLYQTQMTTDSRVRGIFREGASGSYVYHVMGDSRRPIAYVSWQSAARFVNWLQNGQTSGGTENGVYNLEFLPNLTIAQIRQPGATLALPTTDEWYKAAYYDPAKNGGAGGYWAFAIRADALVNNLVSANYFDGDYATTQSSAFFTNFLLPGGHYATQSSAYGTFDQTGSVFEWLEREDVNRSYTGGAFDTNPATSNYLNAGVLVSAGSTDSLVNVGFRIVSCPPPPPLFGSTPAGGNANAFAGGDTSGASFDIPGTTITFNGIGTFLSDSESFTVGGTRIRQRHHQKQRRRHLRPRQFRPSSAQRRRE
jgi:formylglycine-generating enzyme